ncbi:MAG: flagellar biosynthesis protein FlaG [Pyramidobacter sp.]|nr:flagellar biosynthesis protein FlaG [Pyramidobacter sp.]
MEQVREARVTLGSRTYLLRTALDEKEFAQLVEFSQSLFNSIDSTSDQERRLLLGWMHMAYKLMQIEKKLGKALEPSYLPISEDVE